MAEGADTAPARGRRARLLAVLEGHGLAAAGATALWRVGVELRARTLQTKQEYGAFVDAETGALAGQVVSGVGDRLDAGAVLRALAPGQWYAGVHTHPTGVSFSATDATVLVAYRPTLRAIAAVGGHGVWYVLSVDPRREVVAPPAVLPAFERERDALAPAYQRLVQAGRLTRREAQREHTHQIWVRLAPALGLRYHRV